MAKRTPEDACIEYAIANAEVRRISKAIGSYQCLLEAEFCAGPQLGAIPDTCIKQFYTTHVEGYETFPNMEEEEMCDACKSKHALVLERKVARQRFGKAKRMVTSVGKRLNAAAPDGRAKGKV